MDLSKRLVEKEVPEIVGIPPGL